MQIINKEVWVIMSKDRKVIAKGTPRNRKLILIDDAKDKNRITTYSSKGMAEAGYKNSWFYQYNQTRYTREDLEAVKVELIMRIVNEN